MRGSILALALGTVSKGFLTVHHHRGHKDTKEKPSEVEQR